MNFDSLRKMVGGVVLELGDGQGLAEGVHSMTAPNVKALLNGIVGIAPGWKHLEVGTHQGGTFIAAMQGNMDAYGVSYDDWSQFWFVREGFTKDVLADNMKKFAPLMGQTELVRKNFFERKEIPAIVNPPDSFFYDGAHEAEFQEKATIAAFEVCADPFVYIVDDWNEYGAKEGTEAGIAACKPSQIRRWELGAPDSGEMFYQGIGLFVVSK